MTIELTIAGAAHLLDLQGGVTPDPSRIFDGLIFGKGNTEPTDMDTVDSVDKFAGVVLPVESGYPKKDELDVRNSGRGVETWTWKFVREAVGSLLASNVAVTNYSGGDALIGTDPLMVHAHQDVAQRLDERLIIWVNAQTGYDPTIVTATEPSLQNRTVRVESYTARTRAMQTWPVGSVVDNSESRCRPQPGQHIATLADIPGVDGRGLTPNDVTRFTFTASKYDAASGEYVVLEKDNLNCFKHTTAAPVIGDPRWRTTGGYNAFHTWHQPKGTKEGTFRLSYEMVLCDRDVRAWQTIAEVR